MRPPTGTPAGQPPAWRAWWSKAGRADTAPARGWRKIRFRDSTEAIIGGITGTRQRPETLLLGRLDHTGRLRYLGRTAPLTAHQAADLAPRLAAPRLRRGAGPEHPWPRPLPATWTPQFGQREPLSYLQVQPVLVVEVQVDAAHEPDIWRHGARYLRYRPDLSTYDVPLVKMNANAPLGEGARW